MSDEIGVAMGTAEATGDAEVSKHKALKVPIDAFESYLERMRPGRKCVFCTQGIYQVAPSPVGGTAGVVATPVPNVAKLGVWFFVATCDVCGDTKFFHAGQAFAGMSSEQP